MIDVTNGTKRNELPFVSFVGKDSHGKTFTVLRAFVANERAFTFYWLLKLFVSKTLPQKYREHVRVCSRVRWFKIRDINSNFPVALN